MKKRNLIWHPFLFAIYPVLFLLGHNVDQVALSQGIRPLFITLSLATLLFVLFGIATKDWPQAGLTASLIVILLLSYGHVYRVLNEAGSVLADRRILGAIWLILLTGGMLLKWKIPNVPLVTQMLNTITAVLLIFPIYSIIVFLIQSGGQTEIEQVSPLAEYQQAERESSSEMPDIYYIVLDGYGRSDILQQYYDFDNSAFIEALTERGFYVVEDGRSNYNQTSLSLSSTLNLNYLTELSAAQNASSRDRAPLTELIRQSEVRHFLEDAGYQLISFDTGYTPTEIRDADIYLTYNPEIINDLENMMLIGSAAVALGGRMNGLFSPFLCDVQRGLIEHSFEQLAEIPTVSGPNFVFAHLLSPHPPFIFSETGEPVEHGGSNGLDGSFFYVLTDDY